MLETRNLYKDYINSVQNKIAAVTVKIEQYSGSQEYLKNCIINNRSEFEDLGINLDNLFSNPYIAYVNIIQIKEAGKKSY